ncbi:PREDICTED: adhesive plaque matrix protein 2 isoform X2 [Nicrophorus vespilloides]|uniref:Adhesive plaque matrix protein 2 isoform X2 n=1 Tax=Nicrophorus vespilloides TaxID=110193 RepID=A0ABM1MXE1_NICVS|nr:PREDICTED: adhesive plaque matrix protein 2 isoform X2 [Nicrophorus vespilloides]
MWVRSMLLAAFLVLLLETSAMGQSTVCTSSTCGQNAQCSMVGGRPVCSCFRGYMGDPLHHCRKAECLDNSECRGHQTCKNEHCVDPCADVCGPNAKCETRNHIPICTCPAGYTGNPLSGCRRFDPSELCHPSPCGPNTNCEVVNGTPTCKCLSGYHGSPLAGCRHECETNSECGSNLACVDFKCQNPCQTQCGINAECEGVRSSNAVCKCPRGYYGNPYTSCQPECTSHSDCPRSKPACFYNSCKNPCDGVCGVGANCELRDITPVCSCPRDMTGDPFVRCRPFEKRDLCEPNPCGENAHCEPGYDRYNKERPVCTCLSGYQGDPLRGCIRGECTEDSHCGDHRACINYKCENPCVGQCGANADCTPRRHLAVCTCAPGYNGDALINCYKVSGAAVTRRYRRFVMDFEKNATKTD